MNKRSQARECAFKLVFEYLFTAERDELLLQEFLSQYALESEQDYLLAVYGGVIDNLQSMQQQIAEKSANFAKERIFKIDEAIMLVALQEIFYMPEIPYAVSINEAVELAKKYSTPKSNAFINGVLSKFKKPE